MKQHNWGVLLGNFVARYPWWMILLSVVVVMLMATQLKHLTFNQNYRVFFADDNPHVMAFDEIQQKYTKAENIMIVVLPKEDGDIFEETVFNAPWLTPLSESLRQQLENLTGLGEQLVACARDGNGDDAWRRATRATYEEFAELFLELDAGVQILLTRSVPE